MRRECVARGKGLGGGAPSLSAVCLGPPSPCIRHPPPAPPPSSFPSQNFYLGRWNAEQIRLMGMLARRMYDAAVVQPLHLPPPPPLPPPAEGTADLAPGFQAWTPMLIYAQLNASQPMACVDLLLRQGDGGGCGGGGVGAQCQ